MWVWFVVIALGGPLLNGDAAGKANFFFYLSRNLGNLAQRGAMASWEQLGAQLAWVAVVQLTLSLLSAAVSPVCQWLTEHSDLWMEFKLKWSRPTCSTLFQARADELCCVLSLPDECLAARVCCVARTGHLEQPASQTWFSNFVGTMQMAFSVLVVAMWVYSTYAREAATEDRHPAFFYIELASCAFFLFSYIREHVRDEFSIKHVWSLESIIDAVCIVSLMVAAGGVGGSLFPEPTWLTLTYLRGGSTVCAHCPLVWRAQRVVSPQI